MSKKSTGQVVIERLKDFTEALEKGEVISELFTCRKVELDLHPQPYDARLVKKTRELLGASQAIFAKFLGVSVKLVSAWEQGKKEPSDMACRFMDEIRDNLDSMRKKLRASIKTKKAKCGA